jgi:predicted nucleotidyltransferase
MLQTAFHTRTDDWPADRYALRKSILKVLAYFDIFRYPLTRDEIKRFADTVLSDRELDTILEQLLQDKDIHLLNGFYGLQDNPLLVFRRIQNNQHATVLIEKAKKIGRFLYRFPFVRSVSLSGSLSKDVADEKADIDFFIITKANRLWIARTLMHLYKKLTYLTGRQHFYCMNYYIDEKALLLGDQNIFTAIELKTLKPVAGTATTTAFFDNNKWADGWLPAAAFREQESADKKRSLFKKAAEWLMNNRLFDSVDNYLFRLTTRRWQQKERAGKKNDKGLVMNLLTDKHFARTNPGSFQQKVLDRYAQRLKQLQIE